MESSYSYLTEQKEKLFDLTRILDSAVDKIRNAIEKKK